MQMRLNWFKHYSLTSLIISLMVYALCYQFDKYHSSELKPAIISSSDMLNAFIDEEIPQRVNDLSAIASALELYKLEYNSYPVSSNNGRGFDGIYSSWGDSKTEWIQGLTPKFIQKLPRDPRMHSVPHEQYVYRSNGANYILLAYNPPDCAHIYKRNPKLVPENRFCWAYGLWSARASNW